MKFADIDTSRSPIVKITFNAIDLNDQLLTEHLYELEQAVRNNKNCFIILDVSNIKYISSEYRIRIGTWIKENESLIKDNVFKEAMVTSSLVVKMMIKGIFLIKKPPIPYVVVSTVQEAEEWLNPELVAIN